jgi:hypothetical protein
MSINRIVCFGDGFAANHIWPEWPAIIQALYPDITVKNYGEIGAGNEFITSAIISEHRQHTDAFFLVQWAQHNRFDKLLQDNSWDDIIAQDTVYYFNKVTLDNNIWWLSSNSTQPSILDYRNHYIQNVQSRLRTENYIYLVSELLKNKSLSFSTNDLEQYSRQKQFLETRQTEIQPSPIVHLKWVEEKILPNMPMQPHPDRLAELKNRINQQKWVSYDPDRVQIWLNISNF